MKIIMLEMFFSWLLFLFLFDLPGLAAMNHEFKRQNTNTASSGLVPYVGVCSTCWQSDLTIPFTIPSGPDSTSVPGVNDNSPISENTLVPSYFGSILPTCPNWVACASCSNGFSCTSATTTTDLTMSTASNTNDQISESSYTEIQTLAYAGYTTDLRSLSGSNPSTDADLPTSASSNPGLTVYLPVITSGTSRKSTDLPESLSKPPVVSRSSICLTISLPTSDIYGNIKTTLCLQGGPYTDSKISSSDIPNTTSLSLTVTSSSTESFSTNTPAESQLSSYGYISAPTTSITVTRNPTQSINPIFDNFEICPTCSAGFSCPSSTIPGTISLPSLSSVITTPASSRCDGWLPCDSCLSAYACPLVLSIPVLDYSSSSGVTTVYTCPGGHSTSTVSVKTLDGEIITCNNWQSCPTCDLSYTCLSASSTPLPSSTHLDGYYTLPEATKTGLLSPETTTQVPATPTCINYVICPTCVLGYVCLKTTPETYQLVTTTVATTPPSLIYYSVSDPISTITLPLPPICDSYTPCTTCIYGLTCAIPSTSSTSSLRTSISPSEQIKTITETMVYIYNTCGQPDLLTSFTVPTKILISTKNTCSPSTSTLTKKETCTSSVSYPNEYLCHSCGFNTNYISGMAWKFACNNCSSTVPSTTSSITNPLRTTHPLSVTQYISTILTVPYSFLMCEGGYACPTCPNGWFCPLESSAQPIVSYHYYPLVSTQDNASKTLAPPKVTSVQLSSVAPNRPYMDPSQSIVPSLASYT